MKHIRLLLALVLLSPLLPAQSNDVMYSFRTANNKVVELSYNQHENQFTYRFLAKETVELEISDDLNDDNVIFSVRGYHRGGGIQNAAMDLNDVVFQNHGYTYDVYYVWCANEVDEDQENEATYGVKVLKDGVELADIKGVELLSDPIYGWSFYDILPEAEDGI